MQQPRTAAPLGRGTSVQRQRQPHEQEQQRRSAAGKRLRIRGRQRNYFARRDLREAALRTILASSSSSSRSHTMHRRQPTTHHNSVQPTTQSIGDSGAGLHSAALAAEAPDSRRQRQPARQQPYSLRSPRRHLLEQVINWPQNRSHAADRSPPRSQVSSQQASSSLVRKLMQLTPKISAAAALAGSTSANDVTQVIKSKSKCHQWHWSDPDATQEQRLLSDDKLEVCFHPECAESTVAIRGSHPFRQNGNYYYWEVTIYDKIFGTSMMLGLCTEDQALHKNDYCNLIGLDHNGWSLSHKGLIWNDGKYSKYTNDFTTNQTSTVGLLFNTMRGELSYFLNGENLGVAFSGLNNCNKDLYPVVGSTAKRTRMRITGSYCGYVSLFERTCYTILKSIKNEAELVQTLQDNRVPKSLIEHMAELADVCRGQTEKTTKSAQCVQSVGQN